MGRLPTGPIPHPRRPPYPSPKQGHRKVKKSSFHILANQLQIDEDVNRSHFRILWLVVKWCNEQSTAFAKAPNELKEIQHNIVVIEWPNHHYGDDLVWLFRGFLVQLIETTRQIWNPEGKRKRGRLRNTWCHDLEADVKETGYTWRQLEIDSGLECLAESCRRPLSQKGWQRLWLIDWHVVVGTSPLSDVGELFNGTLTAESH